MNKSMLLLVRFTIISPKNTRKKAYLSNVQGSNHNGSNLILILMFQMFKHLETAVKILNIRIDAFKSMNSFDLKE